MIKTFCDRCGAETTPFNPQLTRYSFHHDIITSVPLRVLVAHLCNECAEEVEAFVKKKPLHARYSDEPRRCKLCGCREAFSEGLTP